MRVAIVNDVPLAVEALRRVVGSQPGHAIAWTAANGEEAIRKCHEDRPDVILMDLVMPVMNGAEATRQIMRRYPCPILVVTATVAGNYALVCEALGHGAYDAVATPALGGSSPQQAGADLLARLRRVDTIRARMESLMEPTAASPGEPPRPLGAALCQVPLVAIGASTGGPQALLAVLRQWPKDLPAAVLVAQHISPDFAGPMAQWLAQDGKLAVRTAEDGDRPQAGLVLLARTDDHMMMRGDGTLAYTKEPVANPFRPSVDVLFRSLVPFGADGSVAILLTGIGRDGAQGMLELRRAGWHTIAQDERTSVVYGMPQAAMQIGAAVEVLPVDQIAGSVAQRVQSRKGLT